MENNQTNRNDYDMIDKASTLVKRCGIAPCLNGYDYLTEAVVMYAKGIHKVTDIYSKIADETSHQTKSIIRSIDYAIKVTNDLPDNLSAMTGVEIPLSDIRNSLVISHLALLLK